MRILFLAPRFPLPPVKGDKLRSLQVLKALSREHEVHLVTYSVREDQDYARSDLPVSGEVYRVPFDLSYQVPGMLFAGDAPWQVALHRSTRMRSLVLELMARCDALHMNTLRMAANLPHFLNAPLVVDFIDALSRNTHRWADARGGMMGMALTSEEKRLARLEHALAERAALAFAVSPGDAEAIHPRVEALPHAVDTETFRPAVTPVDDPVVMFTGNLAYPPNRQAALWLGREVWPRVHAAFPLARLRMAGVDAPRDVRALQGAGVEVLSPAPDMAACLRDAAVAVAPMQSGGGVQTKVLEAMATGLPVVATALANSGIRASDGEHLAIADGAAAFAEAIGGLLGSVEKRRLFGAAARDFVVANYAETSLTNRILDRYASLEG